MKKKLNKFPSFRIVLIYAVVSAVYIYTSDYFLKLMTSDAILISKLQTVKGLSFILITATLLYILVKRNINETSAYYKEIIDIRQLAQEEYSTLFNNSPLPMWIFDIETLRFLHVNDASCELYGYTYQEYMSMTLRDIRPPEDIPIMEAMLSVSLKSDNSPLSTIVRHRKKNGKILNVKVKTAFVMFGGKKVRLASAVDVSAEMDIQKKLMETNSKLQLASEIASLGYWTNNLAKSKIEWSDETYRIFEVNPKTFTPTLENIRSRFHPEDQTSFSPDFYDSMKTNSITESERRIITDEGKIKWILERIYMRTDKDGNPFKLEGIALDITKRKLHEQEIWESNERFKILSKATVEAIIDWDIKNDTVFWGDGFHTMLGYDLNMCDNYLWERNIHPDDREQVLEDLHKAIKENDTQHFNAEYRFLKADRSIAHVQHRGILIRDFNGKATRALGAMIDLTETLGRMQKIETQNKALKDIAWTQSHVVRAPLANLLGFINLLKDKKGKDAEDEKIMEYINDSASKLDTIIRDIVRKTNEIDDL